MLQNCLLIAGTDTEVGKTVVSSALIAYWRHFLPFSQLGVIKLLQTGIGDRQWYEKFCDGGTVLKVPLEYETPVAPPVAARLEGKAIDLGIVWQELQDLSNAQDFVIAESLGSLGSPVTDELTVADLAGQWKLPTLLVVPVKLGSIGQAIAQVSLARERKVNLKGIILSCGTPEAMGQIEALTPPTMVQQFTQIPVLGVMPYAENLLDAQALAKVAAPWHLEQFIPPTYLRPQAPLSQ
ncbi:dethiobiotin synthase [Picosynechococcus sp. PCC 8807]|uniref:dethiobiotin synthase n=1 Tax=Picosynechococcus sp. PCC 8807 TaxID=195248 RepID=UPI000810C4E7|nr:dethiobiotin synthase [Picosynechococcus sp. PCC 8807]ANV91620.1 dethiobiotin synthase [Picosynechococcus sp. PCC 8807]